MAVGRLARGVVAGLCALGALAAVPRRLVDGRARAFFAGEAGVQRSFARGVAARVEAGVGRESFRTGSARF
ncbi:MAG TPA: hypothetical protein VFS00_16690, partial [Polyangiaceae bacterium]|nr:hypothetical protein [Polyangiaceae bacterium]